MLAFFEFIDTGFFTNWVNDSLGIEVECDDDDCEEEVHLRKLKVQRVSSTPEEPDATRLGSINIVENLGIMLIFGFLLLVMCGGLLVLSIVVRFNPEARGIYLKIKRKIFWNAFIRYVF